MLAPGHTIDRYVVEAVIGTGGTAVVYRVRHRQLNTLHALKVMSVTSPTIRERMIREGKVQAALRHLNVVAVTDVLEIDGAPSLLLEFIEGPTLEDALRRYRLTVADAEVLFQGIVSGVKHAHQHGLVHRDLKPANVLLAKTPDGFVPKVTDFGLAKVLQADAESTGSTRNGIAMGTPHYMAPEQIRDARNVDQRADLFSLGCLLYELVCGDRTFPGDDALSIYNAIIAGEYIAPKTLVPDLPERLDVAIRGCLALKPERRIPDCGMLLAVMKGEHAWDVEAPPVYVQPMRGLAEAPAVTTGNAHDPTEEATGERPGVPRPTAALPMPLAARGDDGNTPAPAPPREERPSLGAGLGMAVVDLGVERLDERRVPLDSSEVSLSRMRPSGGSTDLTIGLDDSFQTDENDLPSRPLPIWALFMGGIGAMVGVAFLGVAVVGLMMFGVSLTNTPVAPPVVATPSPVVVEPPVEAVVAAPAVVVPTPAPIVDPPSTGGAALPSEPVNAAVPASHPVVAKVEAPVKVVETVATPVVVAALPTVKILSTPPTAKVRIDGRVQAGSTPLKVELAPGAHSVEVISGDDAHAFPITVVGGGENKWCFAFGTGEVHAGSCPR